MTIFLLMRPESGGCCEELEWEEVEGVFVSPEAAMASVPPRREGRREAFGWLCIDGEWRFVRTDVKRPETWRYRLRVVPAEVKT